MGPLDRLGIGAIPIAAMFIGWCGIMAKLVDATVAIYGTRNEPGDVAIKIDPDTGSLVVVSWEHYLIHQGKMYAAAYFHEAVPNDDFADMVLIACPHHSLHAFTAKWKSEGKAWLWLYGAPEIEPRTGTEVVANNMLFGAGNNSTTVIIADPVVNDPGVLAHRQLMAGGMKGPAFDARVGGHHEINHEWVLPANGSVLVRVQNKSGAPADISWQMNFFEDGAI